MPDPDLFATLRADSPLHRMEAALSACLHAVFPRTQFHHGVVPPKLTPQVWEQLTRSTPFVGYGWQGIKVGVPIGGTLRGHAEWNVFLLDRNDQQRDLLIGNAAAAGGVRKPGTLAMTAVAVAALASLSIHEIGQVEITSVGNAYSEGFGKEHEGLVLIGLRVPLHMLGELDADALDDLLQVGALWSDLPDLPTDPIAVRTP